MVVWEWFSENWFNFFSSIGIMGSFWVGIVVVRSDAKTRQVANLLAVTANYRGIWKDYFSNPKLSRVLDAYVNVKSQPVTPEEEFFVGQVIFHVSTFFYAAKDNLFVAQSGARRDIGDFFSLPIPRSVWTKSKLLQNQDFAEFIDASLVDKGKY
jgi:hypothetical protein